MKKRSFTLTAIIVEILIVIIGISIAFWLNNWGEERKERALEQEFLKTLKEELSRDSSVFAYQVEENQKNVDNIYRFVELLQEKDYEHDSIRWFAGSFMNRNNWLLNSNTYEMLKSGGKLDIISDFELRNTLNSFYRIRIFQSDQTFEINQAFVDDKMFDYLTKKTDYMISNSPNLAFVRDTEFQNLLVIWLELVAYKLEVYKEILHDIGILIPKLDEQIE